MSGEPSVLTWLPVLGGLALKSLFVFLVAGAALLALRRASASARHLVCLLALAGLLALPLLSLGLPGWRLAVLAPPAPNSGGAGLGTGEDVGARFIAPVAASFPVTMPSPAAALPPYPISSPNLAPPELGAGGAAPRSSPWPSLLAALWLGGVLLAALRPLLGLWGIARLSQTSAAVLDAPTLALTAECASVLGLARTPALRQADAPVPMTWGWHRPVVLLPADARGWPTDRLRAVLLHELAHVRRRDWLSHRLADLVCALYWFHPLAWLTARRLKMEGEIACDDLVLTSGVAAADYARHLLDVARALRPAPAAVPQAAIAMARTAQIEGRLMMILDNTRSHRALTRRALLLVLSLSAAALVPLAILRLEARAQAAASLTTSAQHGHREIISVTPATPAFIWTNNTPVVFMDGASGAVPIQFVQLAGIASPATHRWWGADGTDLARPVFNPATASNSSGILDPRQRRVQLAFRLPAAAQDVTVKYALTGSLYSSSDGTWPSKMQGTSRQTEAQLNAQTGGARIVTAAFPASVTKTNVQIGIAYGPWKVVATARHNASGQVQSRSVPRGDTGYIFSPLAETKQGTMLTVSVGTTPLSSVTVRPNKRLGVASFHIWPIPTAADDLRIVAVNGQGQEVLPANIGDSSIGTLDQITAHFALPPTEIKEVYVETRPFRYVEFKNVALRPAK